jgi:hypothetical protein
MSEFVGNNENLNDFGITVIYTHFRLSALTMLTGKSEIYQQRFIFVIVYLLKWFLHFTFSTFYYFSCHRVSAVFT